MGRPPSRAVARRQTRLTAARPSGFNGGRIRAAMFHSFLSDGEKFYSWGQPLGASLRHVQKLRPEPDVPFYAGETIKPDDSVLLLTGTFKVALGDSIWLISFVRDWYRWRAQRRGQVRVGVSEISQPLYRAFLPQAIELCLQNVPEKEFLATTYKLPGLQFPLDRGGGIKSWAMNRSMVSWLYQSCGMVFDGLPDWGEFAPPAVLDPPKAFFRRIGVPSEPFIFFQANSTSRTRTLSPASRLKLMQHLLAHYGRPVYLVDTEEHNAELAKLPGVRTFFGKLSALDVFTLGAQAELIVSPDTLGIHLGEAFRRPAVGILGPTPPQHMAWGYRVPAFIYGSGFCANRPCGHTSFLPRKTKCPTRDLEFCAVTEDIDLALFDRAVERTRENLARAHWTPPRPPLSLREEPAVMHPFGA